MQIEIPEAFEGLFTPKPFKVYFGGRGAAKSESFGRALLAKGMTESVGFLCARELQVSIADSVHSLLEHTVNLYPGFQAFYKVGQKEIVGKNGSFFIFKGLKHNIAEIKSLHGIKYCWVEEAQAVSNKSWETLLPTLREDGSEFWISFNPRNPTDPTYQRFVLNADDDMIVRKVSWRDNPYFPEVLKLQRAKLEKQDLEAYQHVWEGEFDTRYSGCVYAKYVKQEQIKDIPYDPSIPIYTAWDLGYDDATAIIFYQLARGEIRVIDYYESNFEDIKHYCEVIYGCKLIVKDRDAATGKVLKWEFGERLDETRSGYNYMGGVHYVPHDAANKLQAAAGRSIVEQAQEFGITLTVIQAASQQDNEAALRKTLASTWFNQETTKDLVQALMHYHYEYDEDRKIFKKLPEHEWSSHACDAMELMARMWTQGKRDITQIAKDTHDNKVMALRRKHKLDGGGDPYRTNKLKAKR